MSSFPDSQPAPEPESAGAEISVHSARKEGREVVRLRSVEQGGPCVIECEVYPVGGMRIEPLRPGPYRFSTRTDADAFLKEAVLALTYLGCDVAHFGP
jgi:hypothetical protein